MSFYILKGYIYRMFYFSQQAFQL